jgi:hypothetical protein
MSVSRKSSLRNRLSGLGLFAHAGLLAGVLSLAWLVAVPVALATSGEAGLIAAAAGGLISLAGAEGALVLSALFRGPAAAMYALAVGMLARTIVPLVLGVALHLGVPRLASAGMIFYLLGFYLVALAAETALVIAKIAPHASGKAV